MKQQISIKKKLFAVVFLSALIGMTGTAVDGAFNTAAAALAEADCRVCHTGGNSGNMANTHHVLQAKQCNDCHPNTWDTSCSCYKVEVIRDCTVCHSSEGHAADHDSVGVPADLCTQCHNTNVVVEHVDNRNLSCSVCHDNPAYDMIIDNGKNGIFVTCNDCHGGSSQGHAADHDFVGVPSEACTQCHNTNVVVEHVDNRNFTCSVCHENPAYATVINDGRNGIFVSCYDCHAVNNHHDTTEAQSGDCTYCHADPRVMALGTTLPNNVSVPSNAIVPSGQLACRQCHGTNKHNNGGPIQDYGACFSCHQPTPFHPKPSSWPGWYGENQDPVGRGSFNLFYSEFRPRCAGDCEDSLENRSGYGEDSRPANDTGRNWRSPSIDYSMVTFYDYFNTRRSWTVPIFDPIVPSVPDDLNGGGTTGGNDSVTITRSEYDSSRDRLTVYATNALEDTVNLSVSYDNNNYAMNWDSRDDRWEIQISSRSCDDSTIEVSSSAGGSDSSTVSNCSSSSSSWRD